MIIQINSKRLRKWEFTGYRILSGQYRDYKWVIYSIQESKIYPGCWQFDMDIISLKSNVIAHRDLHHAMHLLPVINGMNRRIETLMYD
jgi:hypothetical protein